MSDDRRIGLAIRYVTPDVRQAELGRDDAMPVRGVVRIGGWIPVAGAAALFTPSNLALYDEVPRHQSTALLAGATQSVDMYEGTQA